MGQSQKPKYGLPTTLAPETERENEISHGHKRKDEEPRVRCPKCDWSPTPASLWICVCKHNWNTFDTGGICPACLFQWTSTQCLACGVFSAHSSWYTHSESA